jgi:hypothetical protein
MQGEIASAGDAVQPVVARGAESMREKSDEVLAQARDQVGERTTQAGEQLRSVADAARQVGQTLRDQEGKEQPARLVDGVAERVDRLGSYLEESDANSMLDELDRLGRRSPAAVMAGGVAVGVLLARFLKASSDNRARRTNGGSAAASTPPALDRGDPLPTPDAVPPGVAGSPGSTRETMPGQAVPSGAGSR